VTDIPVPTFASLGLSADTVSVLEGAGYTIPTAIQAQAIPVALQGGDVLGCAQTGTGKTASYALPMIETLRKGRAKAKMPRALVLAPTREIALQVSEAITQFGMNLQHALLIGGTSPVEQERQLLRGADILVGTPGRLLDFMERGKILMMDIRMVVIDEADRMLDMGFIPDIEKIMGRLPAGRQTMMFSATMPPDIRKLADRFLRNPTEITITPKVMTAATITQYLCKVPSGFTGKREYLRTLLRQENIEKAIIFCNRKRDVAVLAKSLERHGFAVGELHGDMTQGERLRTLERFKNDEFRFLAASDVAARGIHIEALPVVINFDIPIHAEDYVHRIGRTGRAGQEGCAYSFMAPDQDKFLQAIIKYCNPAFTAYDKISVDDIPEKSKPERKTSRKPSSAAARPAAERTTERPARKTPSATAAGNKRPARVPASSDASPSSLSAKGLGDDMPAFMRIPLSL
jgi:superfamily II DNA/RNA helicase